METTRDKVCEACGATFTCCAGDCWCDDVKLSGPTQVALAVSYADCLCPSCLKAAADGVLGPPANRERVRVDPAPRRPGPGGDV